MRPFYAKIIVEGKYDHWTAWFHGVPQVAYSADWPTGAIERLLEHYGTDNFAPTGMIDLEAETRDGHFEFLLPLVGRMTIPKPSVN